MVGFIRRRAGRTRVRWLGLIVISGTAMFGGVPSSAATMAFVVWYVLLKILG
jgi:hypothetical protein